MSQPSTVSTIAPPSATELTGIVEHILWSDPDEGFAIARLRSGQVVKGNVGDTGLDIGCPYRFLGRWERHVRHGEQFAFQTHVKDTPANRTGIIKYLQDECPGVGRKKAEQLWNTFQAAAVEIVRTDPEKVAATGILSIDQAHEAADALAAVAAQEKTRIDLFTLFQGRGFHGSLIRACIKKWGAKAPTVIRRNPFALLVEEMPSAGFKRCDKLFLDLGFRRDKLKRQAFCLWNYLRIGSGQGHTWHHAPTAARAVIAEVGTSARPLKAAKLAKKAKVISSWKDENGEVWLAEAQKARNEWELSECVRRLLAHPEVKWPKEIGGGITDHQREKLAQTFTKPFGILCGTPGTGKTFSAACVVRELVETHGAWNIAVCAPTGKAAVRLTAALQEYQIPLQATTVHRLLGVGRNGHDGKGWGFQRNKDNPLPCQFLIVDEVSMLDCDLASSLLSACPVGTHVLWIGDPYQLPPVGHGAPLRDLLAAGVPHGELTEIKRNAGLIVRACREIKDGKPFKTVERFNKDTGDNLLLTEAKDAEESIEKLRALFDRLKAAQPELWNPVWETQVLVAVNAKSELARKPLNKLLQGWLNADGVSAEGNPFRIGDKIICLKNSFHKGAEVAPGTSEDAIENWYEAGEHFLANGDVGRVLAIDGKRTVAKFLAPERTILIPHGKQSVAKDDEKSGEKADDDKGAGGTDFDLAYAITTHKSQGSEAQLIVALIDGYAGARQVCDRNWWYTAVSRAKSCCVLIGPRHVMERHCRKVKLSQRKTFLAELLTGKAIER